MVFKELGVFLGFAQYSENLQTKQMDANCEHNAVKRDVQEDHALAHKKFKPEDEEIAVEIKHITDEIKVLKPLHHKI
jgi:hypothetical protein